MFGFLMFSEDELANRARHRHASVLSHAAEDELFVSGKGEIENPALNHFSNPPAQKIRPEDGSPPASLCVARTLPNGDVLQNFRRARLYFINDLIAKGYCEGQEK